MRNGFEGGMRARAAGVLREVKVVGGHWCKNAIDQSYSSVAGLSAVPAARWRTEKGLLMCQWPSELVPVANGCGKKTKVTVTGLKIQKGAAVWEGVPAAHYTHTTGDYTAFPAGG